MSIDTDQAHRRPNFGNLLSILMLEGNKAEPQQARKSRGKWNLEVSVSAVCRKQPGNIAWSQEDSGRLSEEWSL